MAMEFIYDDGGRAEAGFKGSAGDCVVRAIAIATGKPYREVYDALHAGAKEVNERRRKYFKPRGRTSPRNGVSRVVYEPYLLSLGFKWTPTMKIGQGCKVHFVKEELPPGVLVVALSKHLTCVIDGIVHDTYNPQRGSTTWYKTGPDVTEHTVDHVSPDRCVYGIYSKPSEAA